MDAIDTVAQQPRRRIRTAVLQGELLQLEEMIPAACIAELGLEITLLRTLQQAEWYCSNNQPNVLIIGGLQPPSKAVEACGKLGSQYDTPVLLVSDGLEANDIAACLEAGADEYASGSEDPVLYGAKLRVLLRRGSAVRADSTSIKIRRLSIDLVHHRVSVNNTPVLLTPVEFRMLVCLARNPGKAVTASTLLAEAQDYVCDEQEAQDIVKVHVHRLRQKIERDPARPSYILNVRGLGYMLERRSSFSDALASGA